ncbi:hypothetical protein [Streptomyces sp. NBC_00658]
MSGVWKTGVWRAVGIMPGVQKTWPEGKLYDLDAIYESGDLDCKSPKS